MLSVLCRAQRLGLVLTLGLVPLSAEWWWSDSGSTTHVDDAAIGTIEQVQVAWDELRTQEIDVQLDRSVLPLFDSKAGQERVSKWRRELGVAAPQRHHVDHMDEQLSRGMFANEETHGGGWDFQQDSRIEAKLVHTDEGSPREFSKGATDRRSVETIALYQRLQAQAIAERTWDHKSSVTLIRATERTGANYDNTSTASVWPVACNEGLTAEMYRSAYGVIPGCSPRSGECQRRVLDGFATPTECGRLIAATSSAMQYLFHQGDQTSLAPASSGERLGLRGTLLFQYLLLKTRLQIMEDYSLDALYDSGALLTRISHGMPMDEWDMEPGHAYWNPHVDKANIATYDYSAILYLNTHNVDFTGGRFIFIDEERDAIVEPKAGRLITFTSGLENLHRAEQVTSGDRYILAMWFTCSAAHQYTHDTD